MKQDENSTGQGSNSKAHIKFFAWHSGTDEWSWTPMEDDKCDR